MKTTDIEHDPLLPEPIRHYEKLPPPFFDALSPEAKRTYLDTVRTLRVRRMLIPQPDISK